MGALGSAGSFGDITITILRATRPRKALKELEKSGYAVGKEEPGIYRISGMVDFKMQIVVTAELRGDEFIPLRIQGKKVEDRDLDKFLNQVRTEYLPQEMDYVEMIVKYGIYDGRELVEKVREDEEMYETWMEFFKDEFEKVRIEAEKRGEERGEEKIKKLEEEGKRLEEKERRLEEENKRLKDEIKRMKVAML